ncbi:hypothetical protein C2W62_07720 [Candidatus Entotheonella serta]|nr:hypothetical protein C2W62_07720 [Candidatus Entotheonella serta]
MTKIAALTLPETDFAFGFSDIAAHYVERIFTQAGEAFDLRLCLKHLPDANMLSSWAVFETLDFTCEMDLESDHDIELEFSQAGRCHGFLLWLTLFVDDVEVVDILEQPDSWLPVYLPVFADGVPVSVGDALKARVSRRLCANGLNPDYVISGTIHRQHGADVPFRYHAPHQATSYRGSPFYAALFTDDEVPVLPACSPAALRDWLTQRLPNHMVPNRLIEVDALPLTPNGKLDRAKLRGFCIEPDEIEAILRQHS